MAYSSSSSPEISVGPTVDPQDHFSYKHASHDEVLEDLSSRFILNLPDEELASLERICFQVEQAHWFYEDFIREENPKFPSLPLKKFSAMLFHACPLLHQWSHDHEQAFNTFMQYKTRVPVCGAIMLNETWEKCILVKGWKSSSGWGFPKGKINEHEAPHDCAVREVLEETGYNLAGEVDPQDVIEMSIKEQKISLYIVTGIPEDFHFQTRTRKEISRIEWFKLIDLPTWKRNKAAPGKFYLISPFIGALKAFINERKPRTLHRKSPMKGRIASMPQTVLCRQKQITNSFSLQSLGIDHDIAAQESSSQSSSADNGGPHTPSPQYSEPLTNHSANGVRVSAHVEDDASKTLMTAMDPNLARLLNSLSLSATVSVDDRNGTKPLIPLQSVRSISPASTTPAPITISSASPPLPRHSDQADWSSHVPKPLSERPVDTPPASSLRHGSASIGTRPLPDAMQVSSHHHQLPPALSLSPYSNSPGTTSGSHLTPPTPLSAAISTASISSVTSSPSAARKMSSRRTSSTADISPYLSRPSEIPTSGKRLKQLALLETVADESARMTPQLANRDYLTQPAGPRDNAQGYQLPMNGRHSYAPRSSGSVLPSYTTNNNIDDLRVIYSSGHGPDPMQPVMSYHPQTRHAPPDDPFQVRPRINQTGPMYPGHPFPGKVASMHQNQLLSLLAGPGFQGPNMLTPAQPPTPPQLVGPYPHPILGPPPPPPQVFQHSVSIRGPPPPPSHGMPHNLYPPQGQPPTSAPALSPTFAAPPVPNSNLLSILNGTKSVTTGSAHGTNTMAPTNILNGIMHR